MTLVRSYFFLAASGNFHVSIAHIPGTDNYLADYLSRLSIQAFRQTALNADLLPTPIVTLALQTPYQHRGFSTCSRLVLLRPPGGHTRLGLTSSQCSVLPITSPPFLPRPSLFATFARFLHSTFRYILKGIKRSQGNFTRTRFPITIQVLRHLKTALDQSRALSIHDKRMLWAAFCVAFYGFLRASEFCSLYTSSFDPSLTLCHSDLTLSSNAAHLVIKASKTDPFRNSCTVTRGSTDTSTCPVAALHKYLQLTRAHPHRPLFQFQEGSYLTRSSLTDHLRSLLQLLGTDSAFYASHSFRIGAVTTAEEADSQTGRFKQWDNSIATAILATYTLHWPHSLR